uniref:Uncharacterized protein n=1 Tax=viral metagenome TaxID=1070528 RepID=A0A6M3KMY4_9ZZZZ
MKKAVHVIQVVCECPDDCPIKESDIMKEVEKGKYLLLKTTIYSDDQWISSIEFMDDSTLVIREKVISGESTVVIERIVDATISKEKGVQIISPYLQ